MNREVHVRVCEGLRGKFPRSTRLSDLLMNILGVIDNRDHKFRLQINYYNILTPN